MSSTTSATNAEQGDDPVATDRAGGCAHVATRLCHGVLRWMCDDCGAVAEHGPAERRGRLQDRLDAVRQLGDSYNRRRDVA
jgi:hypothetical protein